MSRRLFGHSKSVEVHQVLVQKHPLRDTPTGRLGSSIGAIFVVLWIQSSRPLNRITFQILFSVYWLACGSFDRASGSRYACSLLKKSIISDHCLSSTIRRVLSVSATRGTAMAFGLTNCSQSRVDGGVAYVAFTQVPVLAEVRDGENKLGPDMI